MLAPSPYRAKDFTIIKRDGWYHCFYIRSNPDVPADSTERDLGHAKSKDFFTWTQLDPVLPTRSNYWDNSRIWAPDIHEVDGVYYMFYTGVTDEYDEYASHQRIGLATSTDLMTWNRLDEPVFSCGQVRWTYCDPRQYGGGEFRDAFVMPNPTASGWLMYYTASPNTAPGTSVVGVAASTGDLTQWVNRDPLWITHTSWSGSPTVESPHLFPHGGLWYLFYTGNGEQPLRLDTCPDPVGDPHIWTQRGTVGSILNLDTRFWFASEYFVDGTHEYFCFVDYDRVDFREIAWGPGWQFSLHQPDFMHVQSLTWNKSTVIAGDDVQLKINAVGTLNRSVALEAVKVGPGGGEEVIPLADIGLPAQVVLTGAVTTLDWVARTWPDPGFPDEIVVRLADRTASSPPLMVVPIAWQGGGGWIAPTFHPYSRSQVGFRSLARSPLGGTALLIDLPEATAARLELFDLAGRRVRSLADRTLPAGATVIPWDERDGDGAHARPGVYFARLTTPQARHTVRVLVRD